MSVTRSITVRLVTNTERFSDLFSDFILGFWYEKIDFCISSLSLVDTDNFDYLEYPDYKTLKPILDYRENKGYSNHISFWVEILDDSCAISSTKLKKIKNNNEFHFELTFTPGSGKRIQNADRFTDYGFYLNQIIPRLMKIGCTICEIKCHDFDF